MTPLAHQVLKQLVLPPKRRTFVDDGNVLPLMQDVHYFDCTAVAEIARELTFDPKFDRVKESTAFLPAAKTWIEIKPFGVDIGILLIREDGHVDAHFVVSGGTMDGHKIPGQFGSRRSCWRINASGEGIIDPSKALTLESTGAEERAAAPIYFRILSGCLALINSPKTIGRKRHLPHAALQRDLARKFKGKGEFRLHPWTQILLEVSPRLSAQTAMEPRDIHLSGTKALHFVRKYLRIRNGRLETVSDHWRGDVSLGIKQSTYRVVSDFGAEQE